MLLAEPFSRFVVVLGNYERAVHIIEATLGVAEILHSCNDYSVREKPMAASCKLSFTIVTSGSSYKLSTCFLPQGRGFDGSGCLEKL